MGKSIIAYRVLYIFTLFVSLFGVILQKDKKRKNVRIFLISVIFIVLVLMGGLRGDFTSDYPNYVRQFNYFKQADFKEFFSWSTEVYYVEKLFALFMFIVGHLFNSEVVFFTLVMAATLVPIWKMACELEEPWLFIILYLCVGNYFTSFNLTRQVFMASMFLLLIPFIQKGEFGKYAIGCAVLSFVHVTAWVILPFYFLLRIKPSARSILFILLGIVVLLFSWDAVITFFDSVLFSSKYTNRGDLKGYDNIKIIVVPVVLSAFTLYQNGFNFSNLANGKINSIKGLVFSKLCYEAKALNGKRTYNRIVHQLFTKTEVTESVIYINSTIYWMLTFFLTLKLAYFSRITTLFCVPAICAISKSMLSFQLGKKQKLLFLSLVLMIMSVYYLFFGQYYDTFYFYWQNQGVI